MEKIFSMMRVPVTCMLRLYRLIISSISRIAGVRTSVSDSTLALTNPAFAVRDRMFLGDHDEPVPFWKVGLKKADFVMLDKWKMAYKKD